MMTKSDTPGSTRLRMLARLRDVDTARYDGRAVYLREREAQILRHMNMGTPWKTIANELGVSPERCKQIAWGAVCFLTATTALSHRRLADTEKFFSLKSHDTNLL